MIGLTVAAGSLVLVHNLYGQAAPDSRWGIRLPCIALAAMWAYDLHLYTVAYLTRSPVADLVAMRGAILAMLVPLFALASRRSAQWRVQLSRAADLPVDLGDRDPRLSDPDDVGDPRARVRRRPLGAGRPGRDPVRDDASRALVLLPSGRMRALAAGRCSPSICSSIATIIARNGCASPAPSAWPATARRRSASAWSRRSPTSPIRPAGCCSSPDEGGRLRLAAALELARRPARARAATTPASSASSRQRSLRARFRRRRGGSVQQDGESDRAAGLARRDRGAWAGIPLLHNDRLVGLVVIRHPADPARRSTGRISTCSAPPESRPRATSPRRAARRRSPMRSASTSSTAASPSSSTTSRIWSASSSLIIRNAERHADNPEFREDMIATLHSSVGKMNDLLARLSRGSDECRGRAGAGDRGRRRRWPRSPRSSAGSIRSRSAGEPGLAALADPARLEQAHDASRPECDRRQPGRRAGARSATSARGGEAAIDIADSGGGMSADFIRNRLFQPFASTKEGGFGIGAFEARALIAAMGGRIEVESREGAGTPLHHPSAARCRQTPRSSSHATERRMNARREAETADRRGRRGPAAAAALGL